MAKKTTTTHQTAQYVFRSGTRVKKGVDPTAVGRALMALSQTHGELTATRVVETATDPSSPLHPCFTWDDTVAARRFRLWEARMLIRSVDVVVTSNGATPAQPRHDPVFVHVPDKDSYYAPIDEVVVDEAQYRAAVTQLQRKRDQLDKMLQHLKSRAEKTPALKRQAQALHVALEAASALRLALERAA